MRSTERILQIVSRYGLVTVEVARVVLGCSETAAIKVLGRLVRSGELGRWSLAHPRCYWARRRLGPLALPVKYAILCYSVLGTQAESIPSGTPEGQPLGLVCGGEMLCGGANLQAVRVDVGGEAGHLARRASRFVARNDGRDLSGLTYVILTATPQKAAAIERALNRHTWPFAFKVVILPDLLHLLTH